MINLIPAEAKKQLVREYWMRSVTVWFLLWSAVLVLGSAVFLPSYVLLDLQVKAYAVSAESAEEKAANFDSVTKELERASETAIALQKHFSVTTMTEYLTLLKSFESPSVTINQLSLKREDQVVESIRVTGTADNRQALATFRNDMLDHELIETVELPISNLAKDRDIPFEVTLTLAKPTTP